MASKIECSLYFVKEAQRHETELDDDEILTKLINHSYYNSQQCDYPVNIKSYQVFYIFKIQFL